jgi:hypothetical protein
VFGGNKAVSFAAGLLHHNFPSCRLKSILVY